jgi:hypothetical protein
MGTRKGVTEVEVDETRLVSRHPSDLPPFPDFSCCMTDFCFSWTNKACHKMTEASLDCHTHLTFQVSSPTCPAKASKLHHEIAF